MTKFIRKPVWLTICLIALVPLAFGQLQNSNAPNVFAVIRSSGTNASTILASISPDGIREISDVHGQLLYGTDDNILAIVETWGSTNGNRVLVVDLKTSAIIADKYVKGVRPVQMKIGNAGLLAVRSKESTVQIPVVDGPFDVVEVNWRTGATRRLPVPFAEGAKRWEITALYSIPIGIVIERGPFLTIFDPTTNTNILTLSNASSDLRPTGNYYIFPDFGLVQSVRAKDILYHITEKDFTTMIPSPASVNYPASITNLIRFTRPGALTISGEPCLIWGETTKTNPQNSISEIVVFDLKDKKELLRQALGTDFEFGFPGFLADSLGQNIYLFNKRDGEIFSLNKESQKLTSFAKFDTNRFDWN